jgi:hypothetical protein
MGQAVEDKDAPQRRLAEGVFRSEHLASLAHTLPRIRVAYLSTGARASGYVKRGETATKIVYAATYT